MDLKLPVNNISGSINDLRNIASFGRRGFVDSTSVVCEVDDRWFKTRQPWNIVDRIIWVRAVS